MLANTKQQEQKDAAGGKKKKAAKPLLGATKAIGRADTGNYDDILDDGDYDDFVSGLHDGQVSLVESLADP